MVKKLKCPISTAMEYIGKKWTLEIIRDLFFGKKHFNEILESNKKPNGLLSGKTLSERLKELVENGIIVKHIIKSFPISTEYNLTEKGRALNKVLYELAVFSCGCDNENNKNNSHSIQVLKEFRKAFKIKKAYIRE